MIVTEWNEIMKCYVAWNNDGRSAISMRGKTKQNAIARYKDAIKRNKDA